MKSEIISRTFLKQLVNFGLSIRPEIQNYSLQILAKIVSDKDDVDT